MLTHIVLIRLVDGADDRQVTRLIDGLRALPAQIPEIASYAIERDSGVTEGNPDLAVVGRFATAEDLRSYIAHPAHQAVVADLLDPLSADRWRIQIPADQS